MAQNVLYYAADSTAWAGGVTTDTWTFLTDARAGTWVANIVNGADKVLTVTVNNMDGAVVLPLTSFTVAATSNKSIVIEGAGVPGTVTMSVSIAAAANGKSTSCKLYRY